MHCGNILKTTFGYSAEQVIHHNFIVSVIHLISLLFISYLSYKIHPLKIIKIKLILFSIFIIASPFILNNVNSPFYLLLIQIFFVMLAVNSVPAVSIFFRYFPIFKRYTYNSLIYAISRALMYIITSFGIIYLTKYFGNGGLLVILLPIIVGCTFGLLHFEKFEKEAARYTQFNIFILNYIVT